MPFSSALRWVFFVVVTGVATTVPAGPWSDLPEAVARLQLSGSDVEAAAVLRQAEASVLAEARAGRLAAVLDLAAAYRELVLPLADGELRAESLARRAAAVLVELGDRRRAASPAAAAAAHVAAARLADHPAALERLRRMVLPPPEAEPGAVWRSPVDGAELVFHPPRVSRIGCTENDRSCAGDEIYFRFAELGGLWAERTETPNRGYRRCVEARGCSPPADPERFELQGVDDEPVVGVTWRQAAEYAAWSGRRLPSEAEWERLARGDGDRNRYPWGNTKRNDLAQVWVDEARVGEIRRVVPVASFPATGLGLFDLAGNVWEWCQDRYQPGLKQIPMDGGPVLEAGWGRVQRGGSWRRTIELARVSSRTWQDEGYSADDVGFRTVVGRVEEIPPATLLRVAEAAFPSGLDRGRGLAEARLLEEDRRYLVRRTLTWLMLEGRMDEALEQAAGLVGQGLADRLALDVIGRFEQTMLDDAAAGDGRAVGAALEVYLDRVAGHPALGARTSAVARSLLRQLRARGQEAASAGDRARAVALFAAALRLAPGDPLLRRSLDTVSPRPGSLWVSAVDGREMVWIPAGEFRFGASDADPQAGPDEHPATTVRVEAFWLDRSEVTNDDYRRCVDLGVCSPPRDRLMYDDPNLGAYPVLWVDWFQARDYAAWAGKRLPTEAEWERAARAGGLARFPWGVAWDSRYANSLGTDGVDRWGGTAPVASFAANAWEVYDLIGNAAEWVADLYHRDLAGVPRDGRAWNQLTGGPSDPRRVVRGGSYDDPPARLRVSARDRRAPDAFHRTIGFRCAADGEPPP